MGDFDYTTPGELYCPKTHKMKGRPGVTYRRFTTAAEAIRFVIEEISPQDLPGCYLDVDGERIEVQQMKTLYASSNYPLTRAARR